MGRFLVDAKPVTKPEDVRPYLGDPERHWRKGYSAKELAQSWISAAGFPPAVRKVLGASPAWRDAVFVEGMFEKKVALRTPGRDSQTDLMVLAVVAGAPAVIAVEGKVREPFGPIVSEWNKTAGTRKRIAHLCGELGIDPGRAAALRYQLFHRCASAKFEAEEVGARQALMLVHSLDLGDSSLTDFLAFAGAAGFAGAGRNAISSAKRLGGVELSVGWVTDRVAG